MLTEFRKSGVDDQVLRALELGRYELRDTRGRIIPPDAWDIAEGEAITLVLKKGMKQRALDPDDGIVSVNEIVSPAVSAVEEEN